MGANQYRVVVAEDEDMNNIVKEETFILTSVSFPICPIPNFIGLCMQ